MSPRPDETPASPTRARCRSPWCPLHGPSRAGAWPPPRGAADDPWDEIARQQEICADALAIVDAAREALTALAVRSRAHRRHVSCDQEDWAAIIADCLDDMVGDTFGCLPEAISRARRELAGTDR